MMNIYQHYYVMGSRMHVKIITPNLQSNDSIVWGAKLTDVRTAGLGPLAGKGLNDIAESKGVQAYLLSANSGQGGATPGERRSLTIKYSPKRVHGKGFVNDVTNQGTVATNPTEATYFEVFVVPTADNANSTSDTYNFIVSIDYIVKYTERKMLPQS